MTIRKLRTDEIECRIQTVKDNGVSILLYKTARVDRAILDETFGQMNWQNDFKLIDGKMYGGIGISRSTNGVTEWIWKWDCGTESNTEAEKGQASDAFKRAGFKWGIGVELYSAPFIWISGNGQELKYEKFTVKEITYADNGDISELSIVDKNGNEVYNMNKKTSYRKPAKKEEKKVPTEVIKELLKTAKTVDYLNKLWTMYKDKAEDVETFKNLCADKKAEIMKGKE